MGVCVWGVLFPVGGVYGKCYSYGEVCMGSASSCERCVFPVGGVYGEYYFL